MSFKSFTKKILTKSITGFGAISFFVVPNATKASELNMPVCPTVASGNNTINYIGSQQNGFCTLTPDKYEITIHEMGLCTSHPITGTAGSLVYDKAGAGCVTTMSTATTVDLAGGNALANLPAGTRPPSNSYGYAYILISNTFKLKGSYTIKNADNSTTTFYSKPETDEWGAYGQASNTISAAQEHDELLDDLGFGDTWSGEMSAQTMSGGGKVSAILLKEDGSTKATQKSQVKKLLGAFEANSGSPVVITDASKGLEVSLVVTDTGYALNLSDDGSTIEAFGSAPFKPIFTVF